LSPCKTAPFSKRIFLPNNGRVGLASIELVDAVLDNPIFAAALVCFLLGFGLSGVVRILPLVALGSMVSPSVFLASYVLTYQQVPTFPPVGATNKIFYTAVAATLIGFILDLLPQIKNYSKILAAIMSLSIVGWIAYPRFAKLDIDLMVTSLALWLGGIALLWRLDTVAKTPTECNGGGVVAIAMLASLLLGFAPVALFGGSSNQHDAVRCCCAWSRSRRAVGTCCSATGLWRQRCSALDAGFLR
jgi:hypothetical protein